MIIYGTRANHLKSVQVPHEKCPKCGSEGSMILSVFNRYAHIFWIPFFSIGRKGYGTCTNCQHVVEKKDMPTYFKMQYDQLYAQTKIPIWSFAGLALLVILIASLSYNNGIEKENEKKLVAAPLKGDVYSYKTEEGSYSLMRVVTVAEDSLLLEFNAYEVDKMSGVYKLGSKPYDSIALWVPRKVVQAMYDSNKIYNVTR